MNKERRIQLKTVVELMEQAVSILEDVRGQEEEAFDGVPENLQEGEKAVKMQECINLLEELQSDLEEKVMELQETTGC